MKRAATTVPEGTDSLYERDFHAWTRRTAKLLRAGRVEEVDLDRAAGEIEDMGKRDAKELDSRMQILLAHLLKWQVQKERRSRSWTRTIGVQRLEIDLILRQSPSLRARLRAELAANYRGAVKRAALDTGLARERFPRACPFSAEQLLDEEFLPE